MIFSKLLRYESVLCVSIIGISFIIWRYVPFSQFQGEGFIYFTPSILNFPAKFSLPFDLFARIYFLTIPNLFKGDVSLYMWFQFLWMILTDLVFYLMVKVITKNRFITLLALFFFCSSYVAKYDIFSTGGYQYFAQRSVILLPLLLSLTFLGKYLSRTSLLWQYFLSLFLYVFSILMGFFGTWFLPPFFFYPFLYLLFNWKTLKKYKARIIWTPFPFLIGNLLIIKQSGFIPSESILIFIFNNLSHVTNGILQELAVVTPGLGELLKLYNRDPLLSERVLILTAFVYFIAFLIIYKTNKDLRALSLTAIASLLSIFLLNLYLNEANVLHTFGSSRYFYFPFTMVAIFWSLFFYSVVSKGKLYFKLTLLSCLIWLSYNVYRINENQKADAWIQQANRETVEYAKKISARPGRDVFIQLPASLGGWGHEFVSRFYGKPGIKFSMEISDPLDLERLVEQNIDINNVYVLHFNPKTHKVEDQTDIMRKQILELKMQKGVE